MGEADADLHRIASHNAKRGQAVLVPGECEEAQIIRQLIALAQGLPNFVRDVSDFSFDKCLGRGGFGEVWLGNDLRTGKVVAIKELITSKINFRAIYLFAREIQTQVAVHSPFIVPLVGFTVEEPYTIITEYQAHGSLYALTNVWKREFALSGTHMTMIALCLAHAMVSISGAGVLHRDLKALNVLLDEHRLPRVCDFGAARFLAAAGRRMSRKIGTWSHMSPEIVELWEYDGAVDVYSYGATLFEILEGRPPFGDVKEKATIPQLVAEGKKPHFRSGSSRGVQELILRCLDVDPRKRPTFPQILEAFTTGRTAFDGTDVTVVQEFVRTVLPQLAALSRAEPEVMTDTDATLSRLHARLRDRLSQSPSMDTSVGVSGQLTRIEVQPVKKRVVFEAALLEVLRNPSDRRFARAMESVGQRISVKQFDALYEVIGEHMREGRAIDVILKTMGQIIRRDHKFLEFLRDWHFFSSLPEKREVLPAIFDFMGSVIDVDVTFVTALSRRVLSSLMRVAPGDAVDLVRLYTVKLLRLESHSSTSGALAVIDLILAFARPYVDIAAGEIYISCLSTLLDLQWVREARLEQMRPIVATFVRSNCPGNRRAALRALAHHFDQHFMLPFDALVVSLESDELRPSAIAVLKRVASFPASRTICSALGRHGVWPALLRFVCESEEHAALATQSLEWMAAKNLQAFKVLLAAFHWAGLRRKLGNMGPFPGLLAAVCAGADAEILVALARIIRRADPDQRIIDALGAAKFFSAYEAAVRACRDVAVFVACDAMLVMLAGVGYSAWYGQFVHLLEDQLKARDQATRHAIACLAAFSKHRELARALATPSLLGYFNALARAPQFQDEATTFLANCRAANS